MDLHLSRPGLKTGGATDPVTDLPLLRFALTVTVSRWSWEGVWVVHRQRELQLSLQGRDQLSLGKSTKLEVLPGSTKHPSPNLVHLRRTHP